MLAVTTVLPGLPHQASKVCPPQLSARSSFPAAEGWLPVCRVCTLVVAVAAAARGSQARLAARRQARVTLQAARKAKIVVPEEEELEVENDYEDDPEYEGPWQHALSLLAAMQDRRLEIGEINVGSTIQACLAVRTSPSPMSSRWQQAFMLFKTASTKRVLPDPACAGLLLAECEQRGLSHVEQDIMRRLRGERAEGSVVEAPLITATAIAQDIAQQLAAPSAGGM
eukprot:TRINITY_DN78270_c0_g1_i1.p1 TRINITY_DN78270_c0_g1~~TRINITY_DN78270_c0_g1_i1.p1  ORF type:complete len:235 (+),score=33.33 TRINITY_DN78270_c0_g1_i1:28-705(+)